MSTVPVFRDNTFGECVYICPQCGQPGTPGEVCSSDEPHQPGVPRELVPSTAVARAYQTYADAHRDPEGRSGASIDEMERGETLPAPAEMVAIADVLEQPLYWFFVDHDDPSK